MFSDRFDSSAIFPHLLVHSRGNNPLEYGEECFRHFSRQLITGNSLTDYRRIEMRSRKSRRAHLWSSQEDKNHQQ
jgi:hypothetical protein